MSLVSIVMTVYNTNIEYLRESISSILNQSYCDFEFIIIDDSSDKKTYSFLESIDDKRIILIRNETNLGVTKSLNKGFNLATGKYIARMDSDDISFPDRLEKQYQYMEENPDVIVCGSGIRMFREVCDLNYEGETYIPQINNMELFRVKLLFCNCGPPHPTAFFNRELLKKYSIHYDEKYRNSQDYAMWVSCSKFARMHIFNEIMLAYRIHPSQISTSGLKRQRQYATAIRKAQLHRLFPTVTDEMVLLHEKAYNNELSIKDTVRWLCRLKKANRKMKEYDVSVFSKYINSLIYKKVKTK